MEQWKNQIDNKNVDKTLKTSLQVQLVDIWWNSMNLNLTSLLLMTKLLCLWLITWPIFTINQTLFMISNYLTLLILEFGVNLHQRVMLKWEILLKFSYQTLLIQRWLLSLNLLCILMTFLILLSFRIHTT